MTFELRQSQRLVQRQELRLTQQLIQKLELLQLPALELGQLIQQELVENPMLEVKEEERPETPLDGEAEKDERQDEMEQEKLDYIDDLHDQWAGLNRRTNRGTREEQSEKHLDMIQNIAGNGLTLQEHLMRQLCLMELPAETTRIVEVIVGLLDEDGYLRRVVRDTKGRTFGFEEITYDEIAEILLTAEPFRSTQHETLLEPIRLALEGIVKTLDPAGVGARTVNESLLAQLPEETPFHDIKALLIEKYLDDIAQNKLPKLARELLKEPLFAETFDFNVYTDKADIIDTLTTLISGIHKLTPRPAREFSGHRAMNVTPEIFIKEVSPDDFDAILSDEYIPQVYVNESYRKILRDPTATRKQKDYVRAKLGAARAIIEAIMHRRILIEKVARRVVEHQKEFFSGSMQNLRPLKMKTLATEFGVHISTISRAVNGKYVQCPQGIFPLKFFFATSASRSNMAHSILATSEKRAKVTILDKLTGIVANENKKKPLSDEQIVGALQEDGVKVSRRAVTKYRKELKIPSSKVRVEY